MRNDIRKNLPDGIHEYGSRFHVWKNGCYVAGFNSLKRAKASLEPRTTAPLRDGVIQYECNGYWHVRWKGAYYGNFKSRNNALRKYNKIRGLPADLGIPAEDLIVEAKTGKPQTGLWLDNGARPRWHVYVKGSYYGSHQYEHQARRALNGISAGAGPGS